MAVSGALFKFSPSVRKDDREKGQNRLTTQSSKVEGSATGGGSGNIKSTISKTEKRRGEGQLNRL